MKDAEEISGSGKGGSLRKYSQLTLWILIILGQNPKNVLTIILLWAKNTESKLELFRDNTRAILDHDQYSIQSTFYSVDHVGGEQRLTGKEGYKLQDKT